MRSCFKTKNMKYELLLFYFILHQCSVANPSFVPKHLWGQHFGRGALRCEEMTDDVSLELQRQCQGAMPTGEVRIGGTVLTRAYQRRAKEILDLEVRPDDTWVVTFPKSGTTWTMEMVWLLKNNLDFETAKQKHLYKRAMFLEYKPLWGDGDGSQDIPDTIENVRTAPSPRFIKSHLPAHLLPTQIWKIKPKIIYVTRNPKDVAISYFHHYRVWNNYKGTQELFLKAFVQDKVIFSPYWDHVLDFRKHKANILFITFEEMKEGKYKTGIQNKSLYIELVPIERPVTNRLLVKSELRVNYNEENYSRLVEHLSFKNMKSNKAVNFEEDQRQVQEKTGSRGGSFLREGKAGGWKEVMTEQQKQEFDDWTAKNLKGKNYPNPYA